MPLRRFCSWSDLILYITGLLLNVTGRDCSHVDLSVRSGVRGAWLADMRAVSVGVETTRPSPSIVLLVYAGAGRSREKGHAACCCWVSAQQVCEWERGWLAAICNFFTCSVSHRTQSTWLASAVVGGPGPGPGRFWLPFLSMPSRAIQYKCISGNPSALPEVGDWTRVWLFARASIASLFYLHDTLLLFIRSLASTACKGESREEKKKRVKSSMSIYIYIYICLLAQNLSRSFTYNSKFKS